MHILYYIFTLKISFSLSCWAILCLETRKPIRPNEKNVHCFFYPTFTLDNIRCRALPWVLPSHDHHHPLLSIFLVLFFLPLWFFSLLLCHLWLCDGQHVQLSVLLQVFESFSIWRLLTYNSLGNCLSLDKIWLVLHQLVHECLAPAHISYC